MTQYHPDDVHVGDDADPHGNGFTLLAYNTIGFTLLAYNTMSGDYNTMSGDIGDEGLQGAVCLVPKSHRLPYHGRDNENESAPGGHWGGNYLTYLWDGGNFLEVQAHWNIVDAVRRYEDELGGEV